MGLQKLSETRPPVKFYFQATPGVSGPNQPATQSFIGKTLLYLLYIINTYKYPLYVHKYTVYMGLITTFATSSCGKWLSRSTSFYTKPTASTQIFQTNIPIFWNDPLFSIGPSMHSTYLEFIRCKIGGTTKTGGCFHCKILMLDINHRKLYVPSNPWSF